MYTPLNQVISPTNEQRHEMLRDLLSNAGRLEDYDYIVSLLNPPPDITNYAPPGILRGVRIGILGGGLAGMTAAFELRKLGADITILEALEDRIGGRVYTYYFNDESYGEFGAMRFPISHETTWYYINQFGLTTLPLTSPVRNNFLYVHNTRLRTSDSVQEILYPLYNLTPEERNTPWPELSSYALEHAYLKLPPKIRAQLLQILPEYAPEYLPLINLSVRQNFEALGLSQGAINLISDVDPGIGALLNYSYSEIASGEYTFDFRHTFHIEGGNYNLPYAFYQSFADPTPSQYGNIPKNLIGSVKYKTGHYINGIYQSPYRHKVVIRYTDQCDHKDKAEIFDYCICTLPFSSLRVVEVKPYFSNLKMQAILELNYCDAQKTNFLCNRRFWERNADYGNMIGGISFTDLPIQFIIYPSDHNLCIGEPGCSPEEPGVLLASYNYSQNATRLGNLRKQRRFEVIRQNVEEVHGLPRGFLNSIVEQSKTVHWNTEPTFLGGFALMLPEQKNIFAYEMLRPEYNNRVFFAGEHTSNKHGWMQGALYTGKLAANMLAESANKQIVL